MNSFVKNKIKPEVSNKSLFSKTINNNDVQIKHDYNLKITNKNYSNKKYRILKLHKDIQKKGYFTSCVDFRKCNHKYCLVCNRKYWFQQHKILVNVSELDSVKQVLILTLTTPTYLNNRFEGVYKSVNDSKKQLFDSRLFRNLKNEIGIEGINCNLDFVYSTKYGYRPHYHCLIFLNKSISDIKLKEIKLKIIDKWQYLASKNFYKSFGEQHHISSSKYFREYSVDLKRVNDIQHLSYYVSKTVGYESTNYVNEVTNQFNKLGRVSTSYSIIELYKNLVFGGTHSLSSYKTDLILQTFFRVIKSQKTSSWYFKSDVVKVCINNTKKVLKDERSQWVKNKYSKSFNKKDIVFEYQSNSSSSYEDEFIPKNYNSLEFNDNNNINDKYFYDIKELDYIDNNLFNEFDKYKLSMFCFIFISIVNLNSS